MFYFCFKTQYFISIYYFIDLFKSLSYQLLEIPHKHFCVFEDRIYNMPIFAHNLVSFCSLMYSQIRLFTLTLRGRNFQSVLKVKFCNMVTPESYEPRFNFICTS